MSAKYIARQCAFKSDFFPSGGRRLKRLSAARLPFDSSIREGDSLEKERLFGAKEQPSEASPLLKVAS